MDNPEHGTTALMEQQNQFELEAALRQGEMLLAHGTDEGRTALANELLEHSGNIQLAAEEFEGVSAEGMATEQLHLAMNVANEAAKYGLTAQTSKEELKSLYTQMFDDAAKYQQTEGSEGYDPAVARAKQALAVATYRKIEDPAAADLSRW